MILHITFARWTARAVLAVAVLACTAVSARTVEGQAFDEAVQLGGARLQLNGVGLRAVAWLKGYAAGLYLGQRADTAVQALQDQGPKRLQLRMLVEVKAAEFAKAVTKGFARNTPLADQARLNTRRQQFERAVLAIGTVRPGDVVNLDYVPGGGMSMSFNGQPRGEPIPGDDFYAAVLRIFLGERPTDPELKLGLLGLSPR